MHLEAVSVAGQDGWNKARRVNGGRVFTRTLVGTGLIALLALTIGLVWTIAGYLRAWGILS